MRRFYPPETALGTKVATVAVLLGASVALAACASPTRSTNYNTKVDPAVVAMYAPVETEPFRVPAVSVRKIDPQFYRQVVQTPPAIVEPAGTVVVDPQNKFLYLVQADGTSMRYGIGIGRQGFAWSGEAVIKDKQHWPKWFPPKEMVARDPKAAPYANGMDGGIDNPLGARALYLYQGDKDTLFRLHGTYEQASIGKAVSSGCVRLLNQDIIDLYERVPLGAKVVVLSGPDTMPVSNGTYTPVAGAPAGPMTPVTSAPVGASPIFTPTAAPAMTGSAPSEPAPII
jgi:lipoprotein-anchoring transpeptidase ErfK/SrfK